MENSNVALIGWNGMKNVGDDAMTLVIIEALSQKLSIDQLFLLSDDNDALDFLKEYHSKFKIKLPFLYSTIRRIPGLHGFYVRWILALYIVLNYDLIIIGGGTLYHTRGTSLFFYNLIRFRRWFKKKHLIVSIGVSVGPFRDNTSEAIFYRILNELDFICLRDRRSYSYCKKLMPDSKKIRYAPDLALAMPLLRNIPFTKKKQVGIILRQGHVTQGMQNLLINIIERTSKKHADITFNFYCFCELNDDHENDYEAVKKILALIPEQYKSNIAITRYTSDPVFFYKSMGESSINICIRLHASILSYAVKSRFIMLSYHSKCEDFFRDMNVDPKYLVSNYDNVDNVINLIESAITDENKNLIIDEETLKSSMNHFEFINN